MSTVLPDDYIRNHIGNPIEKLGSGYFGEVWLLDNGTVVKLTRNFDEKECVSSLFQLQEKNPESYTSYFPIIYQWGNINKLDSYVASGPWSAYNFWYQREALDSVIHTPPVWKKILKISHDVLDKFNIELMDIHFSNFGVRTTNRSQLIFRDLMCNVYPYPMS